MRGDNVINIVVCGAGGVGKSAMTIQFVQQHFVEEYDPTIEDSYRKQLEVDGVVYLLDLLDTAGQEEYSAMQDQYMRQGDAYLMVYSVTSNNSFDEVSKYLNSIILVRECEPEDLNICIFGNKADLHQYRQVPGGYAKTVYPKLLCMEGSAKASIGVNEAFCELVRMVAKRSNPVESRKKRQKCYIL